MQIIDALISLFQESGFVHLAWQNWVMIAISFVLLYLAIVKKYEPLLLLPIAFGMLLVNIYPDIMYDPLAIATPGGEVLDASAHWYDSGVLRLIYCGVKSSIFPCLIFLGVGAMTDFGPLLANPSSLLLGAAAQLGIYVAFLIACATNLIPGYEGFTALEAAAIAIIGGAEQLRTVSKAEKIIFPIVVTVICVLIIPSTAPLIGMLMLGNLFKESGVTDRLSDTAQNALCNIVTIMLGVTVGATAEGKTFFAFKTVLVIIIGLIAFMFSTAGGVLFAKLMNVVTKGKVNPLIGSAGVSAVPMAARVSQVEGRKYNPSNFLLMHAMGPNVAGVIGSAVAAGFLLSRFG